jgi:hypothetical protein
MWDLPQETIAPSIGGPVNTRTIAIIALVIAVLLVLFLFVF